jgi:YegS/Rv2252/BmrU family lipid kinase
MTSALVVGRPCPGRAIEELVRLTRADLEAAGWKVSSGLFERNPELRRSVRRAVRDGIEVVVAVGGDGAIHEVTAALIGTQTALGIIPAGTGNLLAGNLGIPGDRARAAQVIISGQRRRIDIGRALVGGQTFEVLVAAGIGFDAAVMAATTDGFKRRWGKLAYFASALAVSPQIHNVSCEITLDGVPMKMAAAQVFIANFGAMAPGLAPRRPIYPDDGLLEVLAIQASGPIAGLAGAAAAFRQRRLGYSADRRVWRGQAHTVVISTDQPCPVEIDGDLVGLTPIEVSILPRSLNVIVPTLLV